MAVVDVVRSVIGARRDGAMSQREKDQRVREERKAVAPRHQVVGNAQLPQVAPPAPSPLLGSKAGERCPRQACGGLLFSRNVVTHDGACEELVCASCARSRLLRVHEPYRPLPAHPDRRVERLLQPEAEGRVDPDIDRTEDNALPPALRAFEDTSTVW